MVKGKKPKFLKVWVLDQFWTKAFFISHISGWTIATAQTLWIIWEIKKVAKKRGS